MNVHLQVGQRVFSPQVDAEFKAKIKEKESGEVKKESELELGKKSYSVKLADTSPQAEAVGKGKTSSWIKFTNLVREICNSIKGKLFTQDKTADSIKETMSPQDKTKAAMAQNKAILDFVSDNEKILNTEGFLRVPGNTSEISQLTKSATTEGFEDANPHALASSFKQNIRENLSAEDASIISNMVDAMVKGQGRPALGDMPEMAQDAIKLGKQIAANSDVNKMNANNLGKMLGPNFLLSDVPLSLDEMLSRNGELSNFFEKMIAS